MNEKNMETKRRPIERPRITDEEEKKLAKIIERGIKVSTDLYNPRFITTNWSVRPVNAKRVSKCQFYNDEKGCNDSQSCSWTSYGTCARDAIKGAIYDKMLRDTADKREEERMDALYKQEFDKVERLRKFIEENSLEDSYDDEDYDDEDYDDEYDDYYASRRESGRF